MRRVPQTGVTMTSSPAQLKSKFLSAFQLFYPLHRSLLNRLYSVSSRYAPSITALRMRQDILLGSRNPKRG